MHRSRNQRRNGFSFVELLVSISLAGMFLGTAVLTLQAVGANSKQHTTLIDVTLASGVKSNFYNKSGNVIRCYSAPNFGRIGQAQEMRDRFRDDVSKSEGVYCLARAGLNTVRTEFLKVPVDTEPVLDGPESFLTFLSAVETDAATIYTNFRNVPSADTPNLTIYLTGPESDSEYIRVIAIYEIDLTTPTNTTGSYASVRRYVGTTLTNYYDVFFSDGDYTPFYPLCVAFESEARKILDEGGAIDRFKVGPRGPFYFIWWPDPSLNPFDFPSITVPADGSAREVYGHMASKTGLMFTVPMFPSIWGQEAL